MADVNDARAAADEASPLLSAAIEYARRGWPVFPLVPRGKVPVISKNQGGRGYVDATGDEATIRNWWTQWPDANIGIATGVKSFVVVDLDPGNGGTLEVLEDGHGPLPATPRARTGGGGLHLLFKHPGFKVRNRAGRLLGRGIDVRGDGGYIVAPPSGHESGEHYRWDEDLHPDRIPLANIPEWLCELLKTASPRKLVPLTPSLSDERTHRWAGAALESELHKVATAAEGTRNDTLRAAGFALGRVVGGGALEHDRVARELLYAAEQCGLPTDEAKGVIASGLADGMKQPRGPAEREHQEQAAMPSAPATPMALEQVLQTFTRWLHMDDVEVVLVVLATVVANMHLEGDPVWILVVGASGGGKTEILRSVLALPGVYPAATLTEPSLLSGSASRDRAPGAKGGLLRQIGERGILLMKDFTSVLAQNRDARGAVLAALREIYDGRWTRHVGVDGGRTLDWQGHVGVIAGCTPTIDRHHGVISAVGERFLMLRLPSADRRQIARRALSHKGHEKAMRSELSAAVRGLFARLDPKPVPMTDPETELLVSLSDFAARARSGVERDGVNREIELIPESEAPTRIAIELARLRDGLIAIGVHPQEALRVVSRVGLDSIPDLRLRLLRELQDGSEPQETANLATALEHPTVTVRRTLEDLVGHGLVLRIKGGKADKWLLPTDVRAQLATFPDKSSYTQWRVVEARRGAADTSTGTNPDISGTIDAKLIGFPTESEHLETCARLGLDPAGPEREAEHG